MIACAEEGKIKLQSDMMIGNKAHVYDCFPTHFGTITPGYFLRLHRPQSLPWLCIYSQQSLRLGGTPYSPTLSFAILLIGLGWFRLYLVCPLASPITRDHIEQGARTLAEKVPQVSSLNLAESGSDSAPVPSPIQLNINVVQYLVSVNEISFIHHTLSVRTL
jgi:hypothetical protein